MNVKDRRLGVRERARQQVEALEEDKIHTNIVYKQRLRRLFIIAMVSMVLFLPVYHIIRTNTMQDPTRGILSELGVTTSASGAAPKFDVSECQEDVECPVSMFCRKSYFGSKCIPFSKDNEPCVKDQQKCAPGLICHYHDHDGTSSASTASNSQHYITGVCVSQGCADCVHGECKASPDTSTWFFEPPKCVCYPGYVGPNCADVDEENLIVSPEHLAASQGINADHTFNFKCNSSYCSNNGECEWVAEKKAYMCSCAKGFTGVDCSLLDDDFSDCGPGNLCSHHGKCTEKFCDCHLGFTGRYCEEVDVYVQALVKQSKRCSPADKHACSKNGVCRPDGTCECSRGWTGPHCAQCSAAFFEFTCSGHGTCDVKGRCHCSAGWTGPACDRCSRNHYGPQCRPCQCYNGICNWGVKGDGTCSCPARFAGRYCENPRRCLSNDNCHGHGSCDMVHGECRCEQGYTGDFCTRVIAEGFGYTNANDPGNKICESNADCSGHGTCSVQQGVCHCDEGYAGRFCEQNVLFGWDVVAQLGTMEKAENQVNAADNV